MRCRRLCEKKASGRLQVSPEIHEQWTRGCRDELCLALVNALKIHGMDDNKKTRELVRAEFTQQMIYVKERLKEREEEIEGGWYTEERMASELKYIRKWKYDESVPEYFVQTHDKVTVKRKDLEKAQWTEDMEPDEEMPEFEMMQLEPSATKEAPSALQAMASANLHKFIEAFHQKASNLTSWITSLEVFKLVLLGTSCMNRALRLLYHGGAWLHRLEAAEISSLGLTFLRVYVKLAQICLAAKEPRFPVHSKHHMLFHTFHLMKCWAAKVEWQENPLADSCQQDEAFVGVLSRYSRRVSPKATIERTLDVYFTSLKKHLRGEE
ncbi:unnamed protein product [Durusdinium trenchii]